LETLNFEAIKKLKKCPINNKRMLYQEKTPIDKIYFILSGEIKVYHKKEHVDSY